MILRRFAGAATPLMWLALLWHAPNVVATYWTVSRYLVDMPSVSTGSSFTYTFTDLATLKSGIVPPSTAKTLSTSTRVIEYEELTIVYIYLAAGSVPKEDIAPDTTLDLNEPYTYYVQPVFWTAPASCPTPFTVTTFTNVYIPSEVRGLISPTATSTSVGTYTFQTYSLYTQITAFLTPSAAPLTGDLTDNYYYTYYVADCRDPTTSYTGPGGIRGGDGESDIRVCSLLTGCTSLITWVIVVATLLPALFILGFAESYFWFRRLMIGRSTLRFGTVCWIFLTLWVVCFTRIASSRSAEDQKRLKEQWAGMKAKQRWILWWKWGFRHAYPTELLGPHPQYQQVQQVMMIPYTPGMQPGVQTMPAPPPGYIYHPNSVRGIQQYQMPFPAPGGDSQLQTGQPLPPGQTPPGETPPGQAPLIGSAPEASQEPVTEKTRYQ